MLRLGKVSVQSLQHWCSLDVVLQIIKSLIKLMGLIAVVYILLVVQGQRAEHGVEADECLPMRADCILPLFVWVFVRKNKKDGYRQRNMRQFLHILTSPGYAPGTIAVNVTWMERRFNAGQTHRSMYPSTCNRLLAIARYSSEIATFPTPLHLTTPFGVFPLEFQKKVWTSENYNHEATRKWRQFDDRWAVSTHYHRVTDRRTDVQTPSL